MVSCQVPGGVVDHEADAGQGDQLSNDLQRVGTPPSPPCLGLCRAHAQVLGSVAAGALVPAVKPRWCCRGLLLLKDDGGDWRKSAGSPLNNVVCHLPSMVVRQRPGRRCRIADLPRPTGLTSPGKCLFGRMGVWSGLWPSAACRGQYIWRLPRLEKCCRIRISRLALA